MRGSAPSTATPTNHPTPASRLRALPLEALHALFDANAARYLDGIEMRFGGDRSGPVLAGVYIPPVGDVALSR